MTVSFISLRWTIMSIKPCAYKYVKEASMSSIQEIAPVEVWKHFHALTRIPRPSKKEAGVIEYMKKFGEGLGLETIVDEVGNVAYFSQYVNAKLHASRNRQ